MSQFVDDQLYHVYNRGVRREAIFQSGENYCHCLKLISKNSQRYKVSILAYCLMPNHYHCLVRQQTGGSISHFLRTTFNAYAQAFNVWNGLSGTLFESHVKSKNVNSSEYLFQLLRYIHLNPVLAGIANSPDQWPYSNYLVWIDQRQDGFTDLQIRDTEFGNGSGYNSFIMECMSDQIILAKARKIEPW